MHTKKIYLAVPVTQHSVGDMGALATALFARELIQSQGGMARVGCPDGLLGAQYDALHRELAAYRPDAVLIVEGMAGAVDLAVYHQVLPHWERYAKSYQMAADIMHHSIRLRKLHNRHVQAGYMLQWMQRIEAPAVYVQLGVDALDMDVMLSQGRALALAAM